VTHHWEIIDAGNELAFEHRARVPPRLARWANRNCSIFGLFNPMSSYGEADMIVRSILFSVGLLFAAVTANAHPVHSRYHANPATRYRDSTSPDPVDYVYSQYA
jgi:hypothetical protein